MAERKRIGREVIIQGMLEMTAEQGVDRVTTRALAKRLGVSEPTLYRQFAGGKAEMWRALAATLGERMQGAWHRALWNAGGGALERLRALTQAQLHTVATTPALPAILFSRTLHRDNAELREGVRDVAARFHAHLEQIVIEGQRGAELRADVDASEAAWLLISAIQGTAIRWTLSEYSLDLEGEGRRVLEIALAGLASL